MVCSENRVVRLMKAIQLRPICGHKCPSYRVIRTPLVSANQLQCLFTHDAPDQAWVTDITYIHNQEGYLFLAVINVLHPRLVVS
jgi:putative transposase